MPGSVELVIAIARAIGVMHVEVDRDERRGLADRAGDADGFISEESADGLIDRAELEAGHQVGDDRVDLPAADRKRNRAFVVERMTEAEGAIAEDFGAGADGGHLDVAGEKRDAKDGAG